MKKFILLFLISYSQHLYATNGELVLKATTTSFPPLAYKNEENSVGADIENIQNIAKKLGYKVNFHVQPWTKAMNDVKEGKYDFIFLAEKTAEREKIFYFTQPTFRLKTVFYKKKDKEFYFKAMANFASHTIGIANGYNYDQKIQKLIDNKLINTYNIYGDNIDLQGLLKTALAQVDFFICHKIVCEYQINKYKKSFPELQKLDFVDPKTGDYSDVRLAFPKNLKNSEKICLDFDKEISKYLGSVEHRATLAKYGITYEID